MGSGLGRGPGDLQGLQEVGGGWRGWGVFQSWRRSWGHGGVLGDKRGGSGVFGEVGAFVGSSGLGQLLGAVRIFLEDTSGAEELFRACRGAQEASSTSAGARPPKCLSAPLCCGLCVCVGGLTPGCAATPPCAGAGGAGGAVPLTLTPRGSRSPSLAPMRAAGRFTSLSAASRCGPPGTPLLPPAPSGVPWGPPLTSLCPPSPPQNHVNLVHRKGRTQQCPQPGCGKRFYLANHLRRHMVIHSGEPPNVPHRVLATSPPASPNVPVPPPRFPGVREFTCETCGKSFKRKNHLEVHRRTHTGETPLQ